MPNHNKKGLCLGVQKESEIFTVIKQQDHLLVCLQVDLLMQNSREFYDEVTSHFVNDRFKQISIDFKNVSFVDSSGAGAIIRLATAIRSSGKDFYVFNLNKNLYSVFRLSGLHKMIMILSYEEFSDLFPKM